MKSILINFIFFIWNKLSIFFFGERCRFYPSCSEYTRLSINKHGLISGSILGFLRIVRCNPYNKGGIDLVPERFRLKEERKN